MARNAVTSLQNSNITLSDYQADICNWVAQGRGHAVVSAVAGSGKSFTLVEIAHRISGRGVFLAFNKSVATELGAKLEGTRMTAKTIHSLGFAAIRKDVGRVKVESRKYGSILKHQFDARGMDRSEGRPYWGPAKRLIDLARVDLIDLSGDVPAQLEGIVTHHALDIDATVDRGVLFEIVRACLNAGRRETATIDFTDMIWLPCELNMPVQTFSWVCVDECQDLSKAQLAVARKALRKGARMIAVGDPRQAIYGFAGADAGAFHRIIDDLKATVLPLSVCYRCPSSHLKLAREIVPEIEDAPGAIEGNIEYWHTDSAITKVAEGDMVICRTNAPLISLVYGLITAGVPAAMRGRDIGDGLVFVARQVSEKIGGLAWTDAFQNALTAWEDTERRAIIGRFGDDEDAAGRAVEALTDKVECVRIIAARSECTNLDAFTEAVSEIFDDNRASVMCSSVHRAKGLEADRVVLLEAGKLGGSPWSRTEWQIEQERNLHYVALTRSKRDLVIVD